MPRKAELKKMGRCHLNRTCVVLTEKKKLVLQKKHEITNRLANERRRRKLEIFTAIKPSDKWQ
jgi:hypothetical protein